MTYSRRDMLKFMAAGTATWYGGFLLRSGGALAGAPTAPIFFINLQANGGLCQRTFLPELDGSCERSALFALHPEIVNPMTVLKAGNINYFKYFQTNRTTDFFQKNFAVTTIFNGIDTGTNNHSIGRQFCASGSTNGNFPCLAAQYARAQVDSGLLQALPFFVAGQLGEYSATADLVPPANMSSYYQIVPGLFNPNATSSGNGTYVDPMVDSKIDAALVAQFARQKAKTNFPSTKKSLSDLPNTIQGTQTLNSISMPPTPSAPAGTSLRPAFLQFVDLAFNAYRAGLTSSLLVTSRLNSDLHANLVTGEGEQLQDTFDTLQYLLDKANGVYGDPPVKVLIYVSTDFGRLPNLTSDSQDCGHYPHGFAMTSVSQSLANSGTLRMPLNTVIGGTLKGVSQAIDPKTLKVVTSGGIVMTPGSVISALRRVLGVDAAPALQGGYAISAPVITAIG